MYKQIVNVFLSTYSQILTISVIFVHFTMFFFVFVKIYLVDVGLLNRLSLLSPTAFGEGNRLFTEFRGALTENDILQSLINQFEVKARY